jgi:hypothetical protein
MLIPSLQQSLSEAQAAIIGFAGAIIGSTITLIGQEIKDTRKIKREQIHGAIVISLAASKFAAECNAITEYYSQYDLEQEDFPFRYKTPEMQLESLPVDWRVVPPDLAARLFSCQERLMLLSFNFNWNLDYEESNDHDILYLVDIGIDFLIASMELKQIVRAPGLQSEKNIIEKIKFLRLDKEELLAKIGKRRRQQLPPKKQAGQSE